jgi:hypothetical protein
VACETEVRLDEAMPIVSGDHRDLRPPTSHRRPDRAPDLTDLARRRPISRRFHRTPPSAPLDKTAIPVEAVVTNFLKGSQGSPD